MWICQNATFTNRNYAKLFMRHIGLQQIADSADDSRKAGDQLVLMDADDMARLAGSDIVGCRLLFLLREGWMDVMINGHNTRLEPDDFMDVLEGTRIRFGDMAPYTSAICIATTRKMIMDVMQNTATRIQNYILKILTEPVLHLDASEAATLAGQAGLMLSASADMRHLYREELVKVYFKAFMLELNNMLVSKYESDAEEYTAGLKKRDMLIAGFMDLVLKNLPERKPISFYAKELCVTPKHLSRIVKAGTGKSPHEIVAGESVALAIQLLQNDDVLIQDVSDILHFSDQAAFSKFFRKYTGLSPVEYRKKNK